MNQISLVDARNVSHESEGDDGLMVMEQLEAAILEREGLYQQYFFGHSASLPTVPPLLIEE